MDVWGYVRVGVVSYLLGSIPSGVMAARAFARKDLREVGSGHTGARNAFRAAGFAPALLTLLADGAKGVLAVIMARQFSDDASAVVIAAALVVVGHCFPLFTRGRGGMGLATAGGVFVVVQPLVLVATIALWAVFKRIARDSTLAVMLAMLFVPALLFVLSVDATTLRAGTAASAVVFARHAQVFYSKRMFLNVKSKA
jgi:glycerol-3-phosphate acyltransferase PlsY